MGRSVAVVDQLFHLRHELQQMSASGTNRASTAVGLMAARAPASSIG